MERTLWLESDDEPPYIGDPVGDLDDGTVTQEEEEEELEEEEEE